MQFPLQDTFHYTVFLLLKYSFLVNFHIWNWFDVLQFSGCDIEFCTNLHNSFQTLEFECDISFTSPRIENLRTLISWLDKPISFSHPHHLFEAEMYRFVYRMS